MCPFCLLVYIEKGEWICTKETKWNEVREGTRMGYSRGLMEGRWGSVLVGLTQGQKEDRGKNGWR